MINDLLPRYYETHGTNGTYETVRSIMIDGHEVAWMKYSATIVHDMMGLGREGQPVESYGLHCECYFTEGLAWQIDPKYGVVGLIGAGGCIRKRAAIVLRQFELHQEYLAKFELDAGEDYELHDHLDEIAADLIARDKNHEFIAEDGGGAHFWGGHFYIDTLARIIGSEQQFIMEPINRMVSEKKITLEGWVIQEYREPPAPSWSLSFTLEQDGYVVRGYLPEHSRMEQQYKLELLDATGTLVTTEYLDLAHDPIFGPDVDDVEDARARSIEMVDAAVKAR